MSYVNKMLLPNENVVYYSKLHWILFFPVFLLFIFGFSSLIYAKFFAVNFIIIFKYLGFLLIILALWSFLSVLIQYIGTECCITNRRIILKKGLFKIQVSENLINKIEDVRLNQGLIGQSLNYGTCTLIGTGGTPDVFRYLANPIRFQKMALSQMPIANP